MRRYARQSDASHVVASLGVMVVSAPAASAKTVDVDDWADGLLPCRRGLADHGLEGTHPGRRRDRQRGQQLCEGQVGPEEDRRRARGREQEVDEREQGSEGTRGARLPNGAKISSTIATAIGNTAEAFGDAKDDVARSSTDPKKFRSKMKTISDQVDKDLEVAGEGISGIDALDRGGELDDAFSAAPACSFLAQS